MMPSSSANVEAPPTAGVQLTEGPLAGEVPAGVHPGALSSNAGVGDTNTAATEDTNGAAAVPLPPETPMAPPARCASCWP